MADYRASIPGWLEASKEEADLHESSFAHPFDQVCGVNVRHFSLLDIARLSEMGNRFFTGRFPSFHEFETLADIRRDAVVILLYQMEGSSRSVLKNIWRRYRFSKIKDLDLYLELRAMFSRTYIDSLGAFEDKSEIAQSFWAMSVEYTDLLAHQYGWTDQYILEMPYRRLIQYVRKITKRKDPKFPVSSISDRVVAQHLNELNKKKR